MQPMDSILQRRTFDLIPSKGCCHEYWNSPATKQYSRNSERQGLAFAVANRIEATLIWHLSNR
jgi:hypothetical protein